MNKWRHCPHVRAERYGDQPRGPTLRPRGANSPHFFCCQHALHNPVSHLGVLSRAKSSFWRGGASYISGKMSARRRQGLSFGRKACAASDFSAAVLCGRTGECS